MLFSDCCIGNDISQNAVTGQVLSLSIVPLAVLNLKKLAYVASRETTLTDILIGLCLYVNQLSLYVYFIYLL
jgi:hypothetical protein